MTPPVRTMTILLIAALFGILAFIQVPTPAGTTIALETELSRVTNQVNSSQSQPVLGASQAPWNDVGDAHHHKDPSGQEQCDSAGCTTAGLMAGPSAAIRIRSVVVATNKDDRLIPVDPLQANEPPKAPKQTM